MSVYKMTNKQMIKFVILYRDHECLWKTDSPYYKNRDARDLAYKRISDEMNIEGFRPSHVAQKIKNLRTTYHQELRKIALSQKFGTSPAHIYKPRAVWFEIVDAFLREQIQAKNSTIYEVQPSPVQNDVSETLVVECSSEVENTSRNEWESQPGKRRKVEPSVAIAVEPLKSEGESTELPETVVEEHDFFGSYVDSVLRSLPFEYSLAAQRKIMVILSRERNGPVTESELGELEREEPVNLDPDLLCLRSQCSGHRKKSESDSPTPSCKLRKVIRDKQDEFSVYGEHVGNKLRNCGKSLLEIATAQYNIDKILFNLTLGRFAPQDCSYYQTQTVSANTNKNICVSPIPSFSSSPS